MFHFVIKKTIGGKQLHEIDDSETCNAVIDVLVYSQGFSQN